MLVVCPPVDELVRASYETVASAYEARFLDELAGKPRDRELLESFAVSVDGRVLEVGCGPGHIGEFVQGFGPAVVGLDLTLAMVELACRRLRGAVEGDMRALPFASSSFGGVVAFYSVIHVPRADVPSAFGEFARVVAPGGQLLLSAHEGEGVIRVEEFVGQPVPMTATLFTLDELVAVTRAAGFDVVTAERRDPYPDEGSTVRLYVLGTRHAPGRLP
jgi:SAM-dependent methyltransferase